MTIEEGVMAMVKMSPDFNLAENIVDYVWLRCAIRGLKDGEYRNFTTTYEKEIRFVLMFLGYGELSIKVNNISEKHYAHSFGMGEMFLREFICSQYKVLMFSIFCKYSANRIKPFSDRIGWECYYDENSMYLSLGMSQMWVVNFFKSNPRYTLELMQVLEMKISREETFAIPLLKLL